MHPAFTLAETLRDMGLDDVQIKRLRAKWRRRLLADVGTCISAASHGSATHGKLCKNCRDVHNKGKARACP